MRATALERCNEEDSREHKLVARSAKEGTWRRKNAAPKQ